MRCFQIALKVAPRHRAQETVKAGSPPEPTFAIDRLEAQRTHGRSGDPNGFG